MKQRTRNFLWIVVVLLLLGAALRITTMQVHGLDGDDSFSLMMAAKPFGELLKLFASTEVERHPKLYFVLLHPWIKLLGSSDFSGHLFSVMTDMLLGAVLIRVTRALFGKRTALIMGVLWATNPLLIWIDGHVRMYVLLALMGGISWLAMLWAMERPRPWLWAGAALAAAGAGYTHILGFIPLAGMGLLAGLALVLHRRWGGVIAAAAAGVLYVPYALNLWVIRADGANVSDRLPQTPWAFTRELIASLTANRPPVGDVLTAMLVVGVLVLLLLSLLRKPRSMSISALALLAMLFVAAAYFALSEGIFASKYVSYILPAFLLVLAAGIGALPNRWLQGGVLAGVVAFSMVGLYAQVQPFIRPDFPSAAAFLETYADDNDAIFILSSYGAAPFEAYYDGDAEIIAPWYGLPRDRPLDELVELPDVDTLWLLQYQTNAVDPAQELNAWFSAQYPVRTEVFPAGLPLRGFDLRAVGDDLPETATPLDLTYGGKMRLRGYELPEPVLSRSDNSLHPPSGWVHLTLYWEPLEDGLAFDPMVRLEGDDGGVYGIPIGRETSMLAEIPTDTWQAGKIYRVDYDMNLNPEMPTGSYKLVVRAVDVDDGSLWAIDGTEGQDWYIVDWVTVTE